MFGSEKLAVWQKAIVFADEVYAVTGGFPTDERLALGRRMRRLAVALSSNIAEGSIRRSRRDLPRFVEISTAIVFEMICLTRVAMKRGWLTEEQSAVLQFVAEDELRMLKGIRRSFGPDGGN
ncbi:four helix bundle protein [Luteolibacter ambystomatis]|uniref:Four helix bundle protein n=1 Tax=Luteolibacter ambystomatis TaxID=2824561 RepID=A0A975IZ28_9BACT|nr:four helix bundle protein [Luteolibacter ambystomatis]QUE50744.1 four helix bundle protein [Luteolibacter ambystomatis]